MSGSGYANGFIREGKPETYFPWLVLDLGLGLDHPSGFAVDEQQIVHPDPA